jgi:hypothetical protein
MKITKEQLSSLIKNSIKEQVYQKPDVKAGLDKARSSKEKKDVQSRRANMKASARGMNEAGGMVDEEAAHELKIYIDTTAELYNQKKAIVANLKKKAAKGVYNHQLAAKLWMYLADAGAKMYIREFANSGDLPRVFSKQTRMKTAQEFADQYKDIVSGLLPEQQERNAPTNSATKTSDNINRFLGNVLKLHSAMDEYSSYIHKQGDHKNQFIIDGLYIADNHLLGVAEVLGDMIDKLRGRQE